MSNKIVQAKPVCNRNMGIGEIGRTDLTIVRQFRWTFGNELLTEHFMKSVNFDFVNQIIHFESYEIAENGKDIGVQKWIEERSWDETLVFTTYDGCGQALYTYKFSETQIISDSSSFDYESSEASVRKISVKYVSIEREFHLKETVNEINEEHSVIYVENGKVAPVRVKLQDRPRLEVEEIEVNFLNAKTWLPGKTSWQPLHLTLEEESMAILTDLIGDEKTISLKMYDDSNKHVETWRLKNVFAEQIHVKSKTSYVVVLRYSNAEYISMVIN